MRKIITATTIALLICGTSVAQMHFDLPQGNIGVEHQTKFSNYGSSVSVVDFDQDGWDDMVLGSGASDSLQFYHNNAGTMQKMASPFEQTENAKQVLWIDYDNDGDKDFFVLNHMGQSALYRNEGSMNFTDVSTVAGLPTSNMPSWSAAWGDFDRDGWPDLYWTNNTYTTGMPFTNMLFRNNQDGTFSNKTAFAAVQDSNKSPLAVAFMDYDNDSWPDIFIGQDKMHGNVMLRNLGNGQYEDVSMPSNANQRICSMNAGVADYDNNGFLDIYVTNSPPGNVLLRNNANSTFSNVAAIAGVGYYDESWGGNFCDFDNDGDLDLYVSGGAFGSAAGFYTNNGQGGFARLYNIGMEADTSSSYANAIGDFNNDGKCDIVSNNKEPDSTAVWMNNSQTGHYIKVLPVGTTSNRDAIGARIEVYAGGVCRIREVHCGIAFLAQNSQVEHVGLGAATNIDSILVRWPSGHYDKMLNVAADQKITITEGMSSPVQPQIFHYGNLEICAGGSVELYVGRFSNYSWSTGATTAKITVTTPGTYSVTTTDQWGTVRTSASVVVTAAPTFSPVLQVMQPMCAMDSGMVSIQSISPAGNYMVTWPNGSNGMMSGAVAPGSDVVWIEDDYNCMVATPFTLTAPPAISASGLVSQVNCANQMDGAIDLSVAGGTMPFTYMWNTGATTEDISVLPAGMYTVTATDAQGCMHDTSFVVMSPAPIMLQSYMGPLGSGIVWMDVYGGTPPFSFQWDDPLMQTTDTVTLQPGTYTVTIMDANGCTEMATITVPTVVGVENGIEQGIKLWPQPNQGTVKVSWEDQSDLNWTLHDVAGRAIDQGEGSAGFMELDLKSLPAAIYWLRLDGETVHTNLRLVKQ